MDYLGMSKYASAEYGEVALLPPVGTWVSVYWMNGETTVLKVLPSILIAKNIVSWRYLFPEELNAYPSHLPRYSREW